MAFKIITITLAILVICSARYIDVDIIDAEAQQVKADIEEEIKKNDITCENVNAKCQELGEKDGPTNVCLILVKPYLCENRQSHADVKEAVIKVYELINKLEAASDVPETPAN